MDEAARTLGDVEADIAAVCGQLNALQGRLVELLAEASHLDHGLASTASYATWQTGSTPTHGRALAAVAERRDELPETVKALDAGEISLHQAAVIARHAPGWAEGEARALADTMTPAQLTRACAMYPDPSARADDEAIEDADRRRHAVASHVEDERWILRADLPSDEGEIVGTALSAHLAALWSERVGTEPYPDLADALVRMATFSLVGGEPEAAASGLRKILVHVDVDSPAGPHALHHLGPALPSAFRRHATCDATYQAVFERDGRPIGVGRSRSISAALRAAIEQRDGGCRVPGCQRTRGLQLHHVEHWEDGGVTETHNLVALCGRHHRAHHTGSLEITGTDADDRSGISFRRGGVLLVDRPPPTPVTEAEDPPPDVEPYDRPTGEPLQHWSLTSFARPPTDGPEPEPEPGAETETETDEGPEPDPG
ncbi:MAG: DUF222 domain-containing protein [Actinomycetota bacterium]